MSHPTLPQRSTILVKLKLLDRTEKYSSRPMRMGELPLRPDTLVQNRESEAPAPTRAEKAAAEPRPPGAALARVAGPSATQPRESSLWQGERGRGFHVKGLSTRTAAAAAAALPPGSGWRRRRPAWCLGRASGRLRGMPSSCACGLEGAALNQTRPVSKPSAQSPALVPTRPRRAGDCLLPTAGAS